MHQLPKPLRFCLLALSLIATYAISQASSPNFIIINMDDMGYADVGAFGAANHPDGSPLTPNMDQMADEGARMTSFYAPSNICSPSRAGLLTGCYAPRVGVPNAYLGGDTTGLSRGTYTIAEALGKVGYSTAIIGKWHLGHQPSLLPNNHGFEYFYGLPFSHDISPGGILPFYEDHVIIEENPDISLLTKRYTESAVQYIQDHSSQPFLLYLAHNMPHTPLAVSPDFDTSATYNTTDTLTGVRIELYADVMRELDWSVGQILTTLQSEGIANNTLVILTSDNGPSLKQYRHAGNAAPFREGKGTSFEGGHRVVGIAWWPGTVNPSNLSNGVELTGILSQLDLYPTIANLAGAGLPSYPIDGVDILSTLTSASDTSTSPRTDYFYYEGNDLEAYRSGNLKKHIAHTYRTNNTPLEVDTFGKPKVKSSGSEGSIGESMFDLSTDQGESTALTTTELPDLNTQLANFQSIMDNFDASLVTNSIPEGTHIDLGADVSLLPSEYIVVDRDGNFPDLDTSGDNAAKVGAAGFYDATDTDMLFLRSDPNDSLKQVRALVKFDLSSIADRKIEKASIYFKGYTWKGGNPHDVEAYQMANDWSASGNPAPKYFYSFNNVDLLHNKDITIALDGSKSRFYEIDVTEAVRNWVEKGQPNYGLFLKLQVGNGITERNLLAIKLADAANNGIHLRVKSPFVSTIQTLDTTNETLTIEWDSTLGADYEIQHTGDFSSWSTAKLVPGTNVIDIIHSEDIDLSEPKYSGSNNFFRVTKLN